MFKTRNYSREEKISILQAFLASGESMEQFQVKNGLGHSTLSRWMTIFALDSSICEQLEAMNNTKYTERDNKVSKAREHALESEIAKLKADLKAERLKVQAYSTMIDVAEEQLGIDIRKKAGAKQ